MRTPAAIAFVGVTLAVRSQMDTLVLPFDPITIQDGLSQGMVNCIEQDRFGFMWFATKDGLNRYDGHHFRVYRHDVADTTSVAENYITVVHEGPNGHLWVGTASRGLDVMDRRTERVRHLRLEAGDKGGYVMNVAHDDHGNIWAATSSGLFRIRERPDGKGFEKEHFFDDQNRIAVDRGGRVWGYLKSRYPFVITTGADGSVVRIDTLDMRHAGRRWCEDLNTNVNGMFVQDPANGRMFGVFPYFIAEYDTLSLQARVVYEVDYPLGRRLETDQLHVDADHCIWIGATMLWRFDTERLRMDRILAKDPRLTEVIDNTACTYRDSNGLLWVSTLGYGLLTYDARIERFHPVLDGSVYWMQRTNDDGLICQRMGKFLRVFDRTSGSYSTDIDDSDAKIQRHFGGYVRETLSAVQDEDGGYWMCKGALVHYDARQGELRTYPIMDNAGRPIHQVRPIFPLLLSGRSLWFGCDTHLYRFDKVTERFKSWRYPVPPVHMPYHFAQSIHLDADGTVWVGTMLGLLHLDPTDGSWQQYHHDPDDPTSLSFDIIFSLLADPGEPERYLWIGTNGGGLDRFDKRTGSFVRYGEQDGLPNNVVYGILSDRSGDLWMSTNKGLSRFTPSTGVFRNFTAADGLQSDEFNRNAFCKLSDGTLFFGGVNGHNHFHPEELRDDSSDAVVRIIDIKLLNRSLQLGKEGSPLTEPPFMMKELEIRPGENMITLEFASMEYAATDEHEFKYQLLGFDAEPILAGRNNNAVYTNLDPGDYTFQVRGRNRDGVWSLTPASIRLTVLPPWYRTWWAYTLYTVLLAGAVLAYVGWQGWQRRRLERTVELRTRELSREKRRSEELLRNILPGEVAEELRSVGRTEAKQYEKVSVLFSDFQGFTGISERLSPGELVDELNVCFKAFDRIMEKHGVEKIKTIGDAYMAAGGVPDPAQGSPLDVVQAALDMQEIMHERKAEREAQGRPCFEMRVGIHTGPVVAGIVGLKKFQYDMWGDTVNIASRIESSGEVGRVNISASTFASIADQDDLLFEPRGRVQVKGKGELEMYFVSRRHSDTSTMDHERSQRFLAVGSSGMGDAAGVDLRGSRILLVEDNDFNIMVAQDELQASIADVRVDVAKNGLEALRKVKAVSYDLVLMDVQMPEMNGYDATRAIRALGGAHTRLPIIAMTANVMKAEVQRCIDAGMNGFIPKPFERDELLATLHSVMAGSGGAA
ncbi:MAG: response regulator [Flavobacteriales bacterium]|nr:response regulator [Flavobacteriales bacterium]MCB9168419.1 response regulator [Flavobacteriales bacterium]